ncbi:hypothetical protein EAG_01994 [Camponotus floridanus]|uniref:Uncharacterized protein n=1 Tax=Camponotus floridanus TaxID=104421 RepID=E2A2N6_CAMFO|nr:hypothetical protein EAG_01994 [Camponotus floridanus]
MLVPCQPWLSDNDAEDEEEEADGSNLTDVCSKNTEHTSTCILALSVALGSHARKKVNMKKDEAPRRILMAFLRMSATHVSVTRRNSQPKEFCLPQFSSDQTASCRAESDEEQKHALDQPRLTVSGNSNDRVSACLHLAPGMIGRSNSCQPVKLREMGHSFLATSKVSPSPPICLSYITAMLNG